MIRTVLRQSAIKTRPRFNWEDPFHLENLLTDEEKAISKSAYQYCQENLYPRVINGYRTETFDKSVMREMGDMGLLGLKIDGYGCGEAVSSVGYGLVTREVERIDSGFRSAMSVQSSLVMLPIYQFGTEEQKQKYLPRLATGELIGCFGLTEPDNGSDPGSMTTTAREHPTKKGVYILSGAKNWITNSPIADLFVVWAKLDGVIQGFLIERDDNIQTPAIKNKTGLRASITGMIQMDSVEVPKENILPEIQGLKGPFTCLNSARYGIAWGTMGALEESLRLAREYSLERKQFGNILGKYQLIQKKLADALTATAYGTVACVQVGRLIDSGDYAPEMISLIKRHNCDEALKHTRSYVYES